LIERKPRITAKEENIVGAPLRGKRVLIVNDVVTAGATKREAI